MKFDEDPSKYITLNGVELICYKKKVVLQVIKEPGYYGLKEDYERGFLKSVNSEWFVSTGNMTIGEVARAAGLEKDGQFDGAVPQDWRDQPEVEKMYKKKGWAVWYYPNHPQGSQGLFGGPVWASDLWEIIMKELNKKLSTSGRKITKKPAKKAVKKVAKGCSSRKMNKVKDRNEQWLVEEKERLQAQIREHIRNTSAKHDRDNSTPPGKYEWTGVSDRKKTVAKKLVKRCKK